MKRNEIYRCQLCGNITEVQFVGGGTLSCCGQPMNHLEETSADTSLEKHVPYLSKTSTGYLVKVGQNQDHPMMEAHYIIWIELHTSKGVYRQYLQPGSKPEAEFQIKPGEKILGAREYCNLHGLWKSTP